MQALLIFIFFATSIMGMEEIPLLGENLEQDTSSFTLQIGAENEESELDYEGSVLFDGSRRFLNNEARKIAKIRAFKQFTRLIAYFTSPIFGISFAMIFGTNFGFIQLFCRIFSDYFSCEDNILPHSAVEAGVFTLAVLGSIAYFGWVAKLSERSPFKSSVFNESLPGAMIDAAQEKAIAFNTKSNVRNFLKATNYPLFRALHFNTLRRLIFSRNKYESYSIFHTRLSEASPRDAYRDVAYLVKKKLCVYFPYEMIVKIFSYFRNKNILTHMLSHVPSHFWGPEYMYFKEREFLQLAQDACYHQNYKEPYFRAAILAQNGWISFSKSTDYPIHCSMKYFDIHALSPTMRHYWTNLKPFRPNFYVPYSLQLAQFYKFEEDPEYAKEYEKPSDAKIKRLIEHRQEIVAQRNGNNLQVFIQNNNN